MDKQLKNRNFLRECKRLVRLSLFSLYTAVAFNTNSSIAAPRGELENWRFIPEGSQLEISLSAPSRPEYFYLSQPPRIVVDLPDTKLGYVPTQQNYNGAIQRIRISQLNEDVTRIVMDLAPGTFFDRDRVQLQPLSQQNPIRWVFRPLIVGNGNFRQPGYSSVGGELPPGAYSPSQPPEMLLPQQTPGNLLPGMYNPSELPPGASTPSDFSAPLTLPPGASTPSDFSRPLTLPPVSNVNNGNIRQPTVTVPPIRYRNQYPQIQNRVLPPATLPSPSGNFNSPGSFFLPAPSTLPTPGTVNNSVNSPNSGIIEFGEPFPNSNQ